MARRNISRKPASTTRKKYTIMQPDIEKLLRWQDINRNLPVARRTLTPTRPIPPTPPPTQPGHWVTIGGKQYWFPLFKK